MNVLISVVVAIYNVEKDLCQCIESVLEQTYKDIEIILVDDGSTDGSSGICDSYQAKDKRIKVLHGKNAGVSVARNRGIGAANGEWIMFVDGDDFLEPNAIERMLEKIDEETDLICCSYNSYMQSAEPKKLRQYFFKDDHTSIDLNDREIFFYQLMDVKYGQPSPCGPTAIGVPWGKLYRLSFIKEKGLEFNSDLRRMQDNIFNMIAFYEARVLKYFNEPLYNYRIEHIVMHRARGATSYNVYQNVLLCRDEFCNKKDYFLTPEMKQHRNAERGRFLCLSAKNIVLASKNFGDAKKVLEQVASNAVFTDVMDNKTGFEIETKYSVIIYLFKKSKYREIYYLIKIFFDGK